MDIFVHSPYSFENPIQPGPELSRDHGFSDNLSFASSSNQVPSDTSVGTSNLSFGISMSASTLSSNLSFGTTRSFVALDSSHPAPEVFSWTTGVAVEGRYWNAGSIPSLSNAVASNPSPPLLTPCINPSSGIPPLGVAFRGAVPAALHYPLPHPSLAFGQLTWPETSALPPISHSVSAGKACPSPSRSPGDSPVSNVDEWSRQVPITRTRPANLLPNQDPYRSPPPVVSFVTNNPLSAPGTSPIPCPPSAPSTPDALTPASETAAALFDSCSSNRSRSAPPSLHRSEMGARLQGDETTPTTPLESCPHAKPWRRLRAKRGTTFFACRQCGAKWRVTAGQNIVLPS
jgi:hypothetical protein